jgi:hypothetical protein
MKKSIPFVLILATFSIATIKAQTIADWTFETSQPNTAGPYNPEIGSGSASGSHAGAAVYSSPAGNGSSHSFSSSIWAVGDFYQFTFSTTSYTTANYTGLQLSFDQTSSSTGPGMFGLFYSINGGTYTQLGANYTVLGNGTAPNASWNATTASSAYTFTPDLSSLGTSLLGDTSVSFRLIDESTTSAGGGTVSTGGTDRVDNFVVSAVPVPEPTTISMALIGGLASLVALRRRK